MRIILLFVSLFALTTLASEKPKALTLVTAEDMDEALASYEATDVEEAADILPGRSLKEIRKSYATILTNEEMDEYSEVIPGPHTQYLTVAEVDEQNKVSDETEELAPVIPQLRARVSENGSAKVSVKEMVAPDGSRQPQFKVVSSTTPEVLVIPPATEPAKLPKAPALADMNFIEAVAGTLGSVYTLLGFFGISVLSLAWYLVRRKRRLH